MQGPDQGRDLEVRKIEGYVHCCLRCNCKHRATSWAHYFQIE
jgi:hypothetical protein